MTNTILFPAAVILKRRTCERYINSPAGPKSPRGAIGSSMPPQIGHQEFLSNIVSVAE
jgi:hypothetical protein